MKKKSNKLAKLERNRFSILTDNLEHCFLCHNPKNDIHEIFGGSNRQTSIKYGLCIPLCRMCHSRLHNDTKYALYLKKIGQKSFCNAYPDLDFISVFGKNYL